jgi:hypothetical protein
MSPPRTQSRRGAPARQEPGCLFVGIPRAPTYPRDTPRPAQPSSRGREPLRGLAAHARAHVLEDGEHDHGAPVPKALREDFHRHAVRAPPGGVRRRPCSRMTAAAPPRAPYGPGRPDRRSGDGSLPGAGECRPNRSARASSRARARSYSSASRPVPGVAVTVQDVAGLAWEPPALSTLDPRTPQGAPRGPTIGEPIGPHAAG